ncbi:hypothetical protein SAMN05660330_02664 [Desulforhopalus singaporensis]|uniref:Uncharacterized protein n=1 Tax=Desulforhopalus singaporensis TaxID=91360 RepID=A0A1H0SEL9_9BACT|nr:hypothetical protein SAMN05660330_02664 [Desulforhopalus singaporensis]
MTLKTTFYYIMEIFI